MAHSPVQGNLPGMQVRGHDSSKIHPSYVCIYIYSKSVNARNAIHLNVALQLESTPNISLHFAQRHYYAHMSLVPCYL